MELKICKKVKVERKMPEGALEKTSIGRYVAGLIMEIETREFTPPDKNSYRMHSALLGWKIIKEIEEVDGITCTVQLKSEMHFPSFDPDGLVTNPHFRYRVDMVIRPDHIEYHDSEAGSCPCTYFFKIFWCEMNDRDIYQLYLKLFQNLGRLKFDAYEGRFHLNTETSQATITQQSNFLSILSELDNLTLCVEDCCVCKELTPQKTTCNHNLCIPCADTMIRLHEEEKEDSADATEVACPICRQGDVQLMRWRNHNDSTPYSSLICECGENYKKGVCNCRGNLAFGGFRTD